LTASYGLIDNFELNADLPLAYYSIVSDARFPSRSIFSPAYYGIGGTYQISQVPIATSVSSMIKIPPGFHQGIYDDPVHPSFLSDGYWQVSTALNVRLDFKEVWTKGSIGYNWRDEEPLDEIIWNFELGFSKVEGTGIFVGGQGVISTGDITQPIRPFYAGASGSEEEQLRGNGGRGRFSTIDRETYVAVSAGAFVYLSDQISLDGRYTIRLFGRNTLNLQGAFIGAGYRF
jgi:hypothetical protein